MHGSRIVDGNLTQESGLYNHKDKLSQLYYIKNNPVTTTNRARKKNRPTTSAPGARTPKIRPKFRLPP